MNQFVKSAPLILIEWHEFRPKIKGHIYLDRLITDRSMERTWRELSKRAKSEDHSWQLFREILFILHSSRKPAGKRRSEERGEYLSLANGIAKLACSIERMGLDKVVYEYTPADVMAINGIQDWSTLHALTRCSKALTVMKAWPSTVEILGELEGHVRMLAEYALTRQRAVERYKGEIQYRELFLIRTLADYIKREYSSPLHGALACICSLVLNRELTKDEIKERLK